MEQNMSSSVYCIFFALATASMYRNLWLAIEVIVESVSSAKSHALCVSSQAPLLLSFSRLVELADIG